MYIVLPAARQTAGKNETSESRQEENQTAQADSTKRTVVLTAGMADLIRVKKAAMAY